MTGNAKKQVNAVARTVVELDRANNQLEQAELAKRAYEMRISGKSWWDISKALGVNEHTAANLMHERLRKVSELVDEGSKRNLLITELERLDRLQSAVWEKAMEGDVKSISVALAVIDRRAKFLGLEEASSVNVTSNTIVVPGATSEYIAALRGVHQSREITEQVEAS